MITCNMLFDNKKIQNCLNGQEKQENYKMLNLKISSGWVGGQYRKVLLGCIFSITETLKVG